MTVRFAALLILCVGMVAMVSTAVTLLLMRAASIIDADPPPWAFLLPLVTGCVLAFAVGGVASWAAKLPGFVQVEWPKRD